MHLLNAFSLGMLPSGTTPMIVTDVTIEKARALVAWGFESAVGHADTAAVMAEQLGMPVPVARVTVAIPAGQKWSALVGQYSGPRLAEGATALPEGASIRWMYLTTDGGEV